MAKSTSFLTAAITGIIVGSVGVLIWYSTYVTSEYERRDQRIAELEADAQELVRNQDLLTTVPNESADATAGLPVAVFEPAGRFTPEQKTSIEARLVEPLFDYYNEDGLYAATMNIAHENSGSFIVTVINVDGSYSGFLYGDDSASEQPWWVPECLDECEFSNTFRAAYPEIVELSQGL